MKSPNIFPPEYFLRYKETPVKLKPYSKTQEKIGLLYLKKVQELLKKFDANIKIRGSTAFKISGKGDVEIGIYPKASDWDAVIETLKVSFGEPQNVEENYVRFNKIHKGTEIELILLKGRHAVVDLKLHEYLLARPELLLKYEKIKQKYCYSKREYNFRKNDFLRSVEEMIPEG